MESGKFTRIYFLFEMVTVSKIDSFEENQSTDRTGGLIVSECKLGKWS